MAAIRSRVSSLSLPKTTFGSVAIADLLLNLPDWLLPAVSLSAGVVGTVLGVLSGWGVFAVAFYLFTDTIYGRLDSLPDDPWRFRLLVSFWCLVFAVGLKSYADVRLVPVVFGGMIVGAASFVWYFGQIRGEIVTDPDDPFVEPIELFTPVENAREEIEPALEMDGPFGLYRRLSWHLVVGCALVMPCFVAGLVAVLLMMAYPLPDLLALGWLGLALVRERSDSRAGVAEYDGYDVEDRLFTAVRNVTRSSMGMVTTLLVGMGLFGSAGYITVGATLSPVLLSRTTPDVLAATPILVWGWVGVVLLLFSSGCLGFWVWIRQLKRVPAFLDEWERRETHVGTVPPRVTGTTIVPVVQFLTATLYVSGSDYPPFPTVFAVVWPLVLVAGTAAIVYRTRRREAQSVNHEQWYIVGAVSLQTLSIWVGSQITAMERLGDPDEWIVLFGPVSVAILVAYVFLGALPSLSRYGRESGSERLFPAVVLGVGCFGLLWGWLGTDFRQIALVFGLTCLGAGGLLIVDDRLDPSD